MPLLLTKLLWDKVASIFGKMGLSTADLLSLSPELRQTFSFRYRTFWKMTISFLGLGNKKIALVLHDRLSPRNRKWER